MRINRNIVKNALIFILVALCCLMCFLIYLNRNVKSIGESFGKTEGEIVGRVIGSYRGVTEGIKQGKIDGANAGLKAEDIEINPDIYKTMKSVGNLEVLSAGVSLHDVHTIGVNEEYKALYILRANAIFTVDLLKAEVEFGKTDNAIHVLLPSPEVELYFDEAGTEKLAEAQKISLSLSAEDTMKAYINSMSNIKLNAKENINNYDLLMQSAKESAQNQVEQLVKTVCGKEYEVVILFDSGE